MWLLNIRWKKYSEMTSAQERGEGERGRGTQRSCNSICSQRTFSGCVKCESVCPWMPIKWCWYVEKWKCIFKFIECQLNFLYGTIEQELVAYLHIYHIICGIIFGSCSLMVAGIAAAAATVTLFPTAPTNQGHEEGKKNGHKQRGPSSRRTENLRENVKAHRWMQR